MVGLKLNKVSKRDPWRRSDDKPLPEPMLSNPLVHTYVTSHVWISRTRDIDNSMSLAEQRKALKKKQVRNYIKLDNETMETCYVTRRWSKAPSWDQCWSKFPFHWGWPLTHWGEAPPFERPEDGDTWNPHSLPSARRTQSSPAQDLQGNNRRFNQRQQESSTIKGTLVVDSGNSYLITRAKYRIWLEKGK